MLIMIDAGIALIICKFDSGRRIGTIGSMSDF